MLCLALILVVRNEIVVETVIESAIYMRNSKLKVASTRRTEICGRITSIQRNIVVIIFLYSKNNSDKKIFNKRLKRF
jgi:hypothetical protein